MVCPHIGEVTLELSGTCWDTEDVTCCGCQQPSLEIAWPYQPKGLLLLMAVEMLGTQPAPLGELDYWSIQYCLFGSLDVHWCSVTDTSRLVSRLHTFLHALFLATNLSVYRGKIFRFFSHDPTRPVTSSENLDSTRPDPTRGSTRPASNSGLRRFHFSTSARSIIRFATTVRRTI